MDDNPKNLDDILQEVRTYSTRMQRVKLLFGISISAAVAVAFDSLDGTLDHKYLVGAPLLISGLSLFYYTARYGGDYGLRRLEESLFQKLKENKNQKKA